MGEDVVKDLEVERGCKSASSDAEEDFKMAWATKDAKDLQSQQPKPTATPVQSKHTDKKFVQHHATAAQMNLLPLSVISRRLRAAIATEGAHHESAPCSKAKLFWQGNRKSKRTHHIQEDAEDMETDYTMFNVGQSNSKPMIVTTRLVWPLRWCRGRQWLGEAAVAARTADRQSSERVQEAPWCNERGLRSSCNSVACVLRSGKQEKTLYGWVADSL